MTSILMIKTGALGDVLRTTALLPGIHARHPAAELTWVTAGAALDLVRRHPLVAHAFAVEPRAGEELARLGERLARRRWDWVISLDDEESLCRFASLIPAERLSGAHFDAARGARAYSPDSAPWFDMGLLSVFGKAEADRRKAANTRSHPEILCSMLGLSVGEPALPPDPESEARVARWSRERGLSGPSGDGPVIGLNTGAGGRWPSKALSVERTVALARELDRRLGGRVTFLVLGGPEEAERNRAILEGLRGGARAVDAGTQNSMLEFSAWIARAGILVTSDSLALHVAIARAVPVVAFFAPTSAAEIELYGRGRKVASTARDACSYRPDADTSTLTVERLAGAVIEVLAERREGA